MDILLYTRRQAIRPTTLPPQERGGLTNQKGIKMEYHVFNKRPSKSAVAAASQYQDTTEQRDALALATFPAEGELWQHLSGRLIVIRSNHIPIQDAPEGCPAIDELGVMVADVIDGAVDFDSDIFFTLRQLLNYKKVGKLQRKAK